MLTNIHAHPTLVSQPDLAAVVAQHLGGHWMVSRTEEGVTTCRLDIPTDAEIDEARRFIADLAARNILRELFAAEGAIV